MVSEILCFWFLVRCCSTDNLTVGKIQYTHPIISQYGIITKYCLISITIRSSKNKEWWKVTTERKMSRTLKNIQSFYISCCDTFGCSRYRKRLLCIVYHVNASVLLSSWTSLRIRINFGVVFLGFLGWLLNVKPRTKFLRFSLFFC